MGKSKSNSKRKRFPSLEEKLARPWCYYCDRDFDDLKILINHQKQKHFRCNNCQRRLNTAGGLRVHLDQVHKEALTYIENALPNRASIDIEIFGMEGAPPEMIEEHYRKVTYEHFREQQEHAIKTGNPIRGENFNGQGQAKKRPKVETEEEIRARLPKWIEQKRAQRAQQATAASTDTVMVSTPNPSVTPTAPAYGGMHGSPQPLAHPYGQPPMSWAGQVPPTVAPGFVPQPLPMVPGGIPGQAYGGFGAGGPPGVAYGSPMNGGFAPPVSVPHYGSSVTPGSVGLPQRPTSLTPTVPPAAPPAAKDESATAPATKEEAGANGKKPKKEKTNVTFIYNDENISPEEKLMDLPKYGYVKDILAKRGKGETALGTPTGAVTNPVQT